jgi:hypothetical protein
MQILEDEVVYIIGTEARKCKRPNAPGSSEGKRFERANQGKSRWFYPERYVA